MFTACELTHLNLCVVHILWWVTWVSGRPARVVRGGLFLRWVLTFHVSVSIGSGLGAAVILPPTGVVVLALGAWVLLVSVGLPHVAVCSGVFGVLLFTFSGDCSLPGVRIFIANLKAEFLMCHAWIVAERLVAFLMNCTCDVVEFFVLACFASAIVCSDGCWASASTVCAGGCGELSGGDVCGMLSAEGIFVASIVDFPSLLLVTLSFFVMGDRGDFSVSAG